MCEAGEARGVRNREKSKSGDGEDRTCECSKLGQCSSQLGNALNSSFALFATTTLAEVLRCANWRGICDVCCCRALIEMPRQRKGSKKRKSAANDIESKRVKKCGEGGRDGEFEAENAGNGAVAAAIGDFSENVAVGGELAAGDGLHEAAARATDVDGMWLGDLAPNCVCGAAGSCGGAVEAGAGCGADRSGELGGGGGGGGHCAFSRRLVFCVSEGVATVNGKKVAEAEFTFIIG